MFNQSLFQTSHFFTCQAFVVWIEAAFWWIPFAFRLDSRAGSFYWKRALRTESNVEFGTSQSKSGTSIKWQRRTWPTLVQTWTCVVTLYLERVVDLLLLLYSRFRSLKVLEPQAEWNISLWALNTNVLTRLQWTPPEISPQTRMLPLRLQLFLLDCSGALGLTGPKCQRAGKARLGFTCTENVHRWDAPQSKPRDFGERCFPFFFWQSILLQKCYSI